MFASMIEAVIQPRLGKGADVSPRNALSRRAAQAATCSAVGRSPATVVPRMSRTLVTSKRRTLCIVCWLSQITRSASPAKTERTGLIEIAIDGVQAA
jgi:hypothetical protein